MARLLGIDISNRHVRVAVLRTSYRSVAIEALLEASYAPGESPMAALQELAGKQKVDAVGVALAGDRCFYRRLELPATAAKEVDSVLAYELESSIPFEMEGAVYDHRPLRTVGDRAAGEPEQIVVFAAIARIEDVQDRIDLVKEALSREPDTVEPGSITLANLAAVVPELAQPALVDGQPAPVALLDLGDTRSEIVIIDRKEASFARTVSRGTDGLPGSADAISRELKQSFAAWRASGGAPVGSLLLVGSGAGVSGAQVFLEAALGMPVTPLFASTKAELPGQKPQKASGRLEGLRVEDEARLPSFAKAIAIALGTDGKSRALNLRQGPLELARSYAFLREKLPLLSGLGAVILVSFGFSLVAELRALSSERIILDEQLKVTTRETFGEEVTDMARANELLEKGPAGEEDPFPHADAFDVMVELSKAVPKDVVHDVAEFDVSRGHAVIQGLLPTGSDAQATVDKIVESFKLNPCMRNVKVSKVTQFGAEKQKYILELDVQCEDKKKKTESSTKADAAKPEEGAK
jgi:general secretion pathway protein L